MRYYDAVGFSVSEEEGTGEREGIVEGVVIEKHYYGDVLRNTRRYEAGSDINDNLRINNQISIVADDYAYENYNAIRYCRLMGGLWKVTNVEVQRPRLLLTIGEVYNGPTPRSSSSVARDF